MSSASRGYHILKLLCSCSSFVVEDKELHSRRRWMEGNEAIGGVADMCFGLCKLGHNSYCI